MFYKQFLKITNLIGSEFIEDFDYWLATIPDSKQENISPSLISARFNMPYTLVEEVLNFAECEGILEKYFIVRCPNDDCNLYLEKVEIDELANVLMEPMYCHSCDNEQIITPADIYTVYRRKMKPDISEEKMKLEIRKRLNLHTHNANFNIADSLGGNKRDLYKAFYNPSESAYSELKRLREMLDHDYGKDTTAKGDSYENLVLELFRNIKLVSGTNEIRTYTNQFDCTVLMHYNSLYPSIFNTMVPYFIIECKNEDKTPSNTYFHKLSNILSTNEAKLGIVFSRKQASKEDFEIAHHQYLDTRRTSRPIFLISMCDKDLKYIIDEKVNLFEYIDFKIMSLTTNARNTEYNLLVK